MSASKLAVLLCAFMACPHLAMAQVVWTAPAAPAVGADIAANTGVVQATLTNPIPNSLGFGYSVAIRGDTLVVGAPRLSLRTVTGCVFPSTPTGLRFTRSGNVVTVMWNATQGAVEYFLEAGTASGARNL